MLWLKVQTDDSWLEAALGDVDALLVDHAHCEHKAAVTALAFVSKYPDDARLVEALSALAVEEATHLQQVAALVHARGGVLGHPSRDPYAAALLDLARPTSVAHKIDRLLVCALIEARSCERLQLLATHLPDEALRAFYRALFVAEASHATLFVELATHALARTGVKDATASAEVRARLDELATHEAVIVRALPRRAAIH